MPVRRIVRPLAAVALAATTLAAIDGPDLPADAPIVAARSDTIRLEVGSSLVDGRVYRPHAARVRVRTDAGGATPVAEWTNELALGDSAGMSVMRWVTRGTRTGPNGQPVQWELRQTYDARTLAPRGYAMTSSLGAAVRLSIDGTRVRGTRRASSDAPEQSVDQPLERAGFFAGASDLVPLAVGLEAGRVIVAPVWSPGMTRAEDRIFTVVGREAVTVEGARIEAWKVEERRPGQAAPASTWWLLDRSPYMVYGETTGPNGEVRRMSEIEIPMEKR